MPAWTLSTIHLRGGGAARSALVVTGFVLSAGLPAAAIFMILDMGKQFDGPFEASSGPFMHALPELKP